MHKKLFTPNADKKRNAFKEELQKGYSFETHMHTSEASACALSSARSMARFYKSLGYRGIIITDHFFNGNTAIPSHLPWEQQVSLFCRGYENAKSEGESIGLQVFFGWEYCYHATEFLTYGLNKEWLLAHPEVLSWGVEEYLARARADGGFIIHAHPFREAPYIWKTRLFPDHTDAVEAINMRNPDVSFDQRAYNYAKENGLAMTSGSDAHDTETLPGGGIRFENDITSIENLIETVRLGKGYELLGINRIFAG
jgi:hypothetical protein